MNRLIIFLWAAILVFGIPATGNCLMAVNANVTYLIYNQWGGTWHDANKNGQDDSLMCWAAVAANILDWSNWDTSSYNSEEKIFQHFKNHWTNNTGMMSWGWNWWFDGSPPPYYTVSYPDVPGGGDFYPSLNFFDYFSYAMGGDLMSKIDTLMHEGYGIGLIIGSTSPSSHAVTCWGFGYEYVNGTKKYTSIYVTDSDDGILGLANYPLIWQDNRWYLGGSYGGWRITNASALEYRAIQNPISPTWVLLGTGLLSLLALRRKNDRYLG